MKKIALNKLEKNIAEYILYMYQMEDLIRAYDFNMEEIGQYVVSHYPIAESEKQETLSWFAEIAHEMKSSGIEKRGHLVRIQTHMDTLAKIHWEILKTDKNYFELFQKAKPHLLQLVLEVKGENPGNEIRICLHSIYGQLLARLKGREIPADILEANERFGDLISYLVFVFHQREREKIQKN
ncbi:DUF4924 family protein [Mariniradius sediminis]|uniref:DUF4924 family protein n=1 Tax=Mariniradius sediminis TaxID=2909237 RepID=A0ABS9BWH9_9BACT|nr:DUF4924 family protein [Mariniradius sediminis]MCF1752426.1 DUF4924 family protein [Mariniradius sediminis]